MIWGPVSAEFIHYLINKYGIVKLEDGRSRNTQHI